MKLLLRGLLFSCVCTVSCWSSFVVTQSPDVSVTEGDTVNITCCWTEKAERMRVIWLKNQTEIMKNQTEIKNEIITNNQSQDPPKKEAQTCSTLTFSDITAEDSGRYICKVTAEMPNLIMSEGNGIVINVTARGNETNSVAKDSHRMNVFIHVLRSLPFLLLVLTFCYFQNKWSTSQHKPAAPGEKAIPAQREDQEGAQRNESENVETIM